ncbi:hypothetical protein G7Y89_g7521 [Cudoniella acicularis]|uniref:Major facilitator superfamily (MFS) profile domain-containing protein n=1 Tax=Cudoniella acicularis TaxID=354080 RepID=A0A8H4RIA8_9HELO|nr:hypothetical protein G7Y89_g7521 [Cudoniella acicularis]
MDPSPGAGTPLLHSAPPSPDLLSISPTITSRTPKRDPRVIRAVAICVVAVLIIEIGDFMRKAPFTRMLEDTVCRAHFTSLPTVKRWEPEIPEEDCKIGPVQAKLAMLRGWDLAFSSVPAIFTAVPYSALADKVGRKLVLFLAVAGIILSISWVIAAVFLQVTAVSLVAVVIGVPLAWHLMKTSVWTPMLLGLLLPLIGAILIPLLPDTLEMIKSKDNSYDPLPEHENATEDDSLLSRNDSSDESLPLSRKGLRSILQRIEDSKFVFATPTLCILAFSWLVSNIDTTMLQYLFQLSSERFQWTLAEASFLFPLTAIINFVVLIAILPGIYYLLTKYFSPITITNDLVVIRGSIIFLILSSLGTAFSGVPALLILSTLLFPLGVGFAPALRSLLTSLSPPTHTSRLYGVLAVLDTLGSLVFALAMGQAYSIGTKWGVHYYT